VSCSNTSMPESIFSEDVAIACSWSNEGTKISTWSLLI
jgi:hypothetical protein